MTNTELFTPIPLLRVTSHHSLEGPYLVIIDRVYDPIDGLVEASLEIELFDLDAS